MLWEDFSFVVVGDVQGCRVLQCVFVESFERWGLLHVFKDLTASKLRVEFGAVGGYKWKSI